MLSRVVGTTQSIFPIFLVCLENGKPAVSRPTVENSTSRLHIMVSHVSCIVPHKVHHPGSHMGSDGIYIIVIIRCGLSLQDITVIQ